MPSLYDRKIDTLKSVGAKRAELFAKLGAPTIGDLLRLYPRSYEDWSATVPVAEAQIGELAVIHGTAVNPPSEHRIRGGMVLYKVTVTDGEDDLQLTFFNNRYIKSLIQEGETYLFRGKVSGTARQKTMTSPEFAAESKSMGITPVYPQTQGLSSRIISQAVKNALRLLPQTVNDPLPPELREEYELCHLGYALEHIHFPASMQDLETARYRLIFEEFLELQIGMMVLKSAQKSRNLHRIAPDYPVDFENLLPFRLTGAQKRAITEAVADMGGESSMNRLIQGDVGSGKTAVAAALCYAVIKNGMQAALMAPTETLAAQHFQSLSALLEGAGVRTVLLTGSVSAAKRRPLLEEIQEGTANLVIGTHALISETVTYRNLGLVITDEQHRFGVKQRSALAEKGDSPHLLVMSATPIPRTLALMIYGDLSVSILDELPPGRQKIETYLIDSTKRRRAFSYIDKHLKQGRQGYIICPRVDEDESELSSVTEYEKVVRGLLPNAAAGILHGKMKAQDKEAVMAEFAAGRLQLLIATTVVEVGVDVPNAVIMLIENAERYGLSQLHQLRGRIGRGEHKSTCILLSDAGNEETTERLRILCDTADGFQIADADLRLRGPGDFFGKRQHGLPQMKIANMVSDMSELKKAQECAKKIVADGRIHTDSYKGLRASTRLLFQRAGDHIFN